MYVLAAIANPTLTAASLHVCIHFGRTRTHMQSVLLGCYLPCADISNM